MSNFASLNQLLNLLRIVPSGNSSADSAVQQLLQDELDSAQADAEHLSGRYFTKSTYSLESHPGGGYTVIVKNYPIDLTQTLQVWNWDGQNMNLLNPSGYTADGERGIIRLLGGLMFTVGIPNAAQVTYTGGYDVLDGGTADERLDTSELMGKFRNYVAARYRFGAGIISAKDMDDAEERWLKDFGRYRGNF